jgi:type II restriction enzyme
LRCVQSLDRKRFTLQEVYAQFEDELSRLHPENKNIRPKIRQQLQVLRDKGQIKFVGKGTYEI